jgi:hypothetical protein
MTKAIVEIAKPLGLAVHEPEGDAADVSRCSQAHTINHRIVL